MAAAGLGLLLLGGCASERAIPAAVPPPRPEGGRSSAPGAPVAVPDVIGLRGRDARDAIRESGLTPVRHPSLMSACTPRGVYAQRPDAGETVGAGERVVVEVNTGSHGECGLRLSPTEPHLTAVAEQFVAFARGLGSPPLASRVELYLGNRIVETRDAEDLADHRHWRVCRPFYAARTCPFSAADTVGAWPGRLAFTGAPAQHPCAHPGAPPRAWAGLQRVTITPTRDSRVSTTGPSSSTSTPTIASPLPTSAGPNPETAGKPLAPPTTRGIELTA